ncbi:MAG TPA: hypothetical protein VH054_03790 [Polyangiaceae bacterium]|jgi:hypothetical protein|nr:hypothetical protein [Polyangiaceae bacterium]
MKKLFFFLAMVACGGQTIGDLDSGTGTDSGGKDGSTGIDSGTTTSCTKSTDCTSGDVCGFPTADACSAKGQCFQGGAICNTFAPGCACDGTTINIACTGLPGGYATAPLAHTGSCDGGK